MHYACMASRVVCHAGSVVAEAHVNNPTAQNPTSTNVQCVQQLKDEMLNYSKKQDKVMMS